MPGQFMVICDAEFVMKNGKQHSNRKKLVQFHIPPPFSGAFLRLADIFMEMFDMSWEEIGPLKVFAVHLKNGSIKIAGKNSTTGKNTVGKGILKNYVQKMVAIPRYSKALKAANMDLNNLPVQPHRYRVTGVTTLTSSGFSDREIQLLTGHAHAKSLESYTAKTRKSMYSVALTLANHAGHGLDKFERRIMNKPRVNASGGRFQVEASVESIESESEIVQRVRKNLQIFF